MNTRNGIQGRVILSLVLVIAAGGIWFTVKPEPATWLINVSSGLIVLGLAGIWVSWYAELAAARKIDSRFSILDTVLRAKVNDAYFGGDEQSRSNCRAGERFRARILHELAASHSEIRILAVAARELLHQGDGYAFQALRAFLERTGKKGVNVNPVLRVLLLHPVSEQAVSRAFREDDRFKSFSDYRKTRLWNDITQSCDTLGHLRERYPVSARAHKVAPACFLVFVNDVVFVEQYHFGDKRERASGKVPILEVAKGSTFYEQLDGHFEHVWRTARKNEITTDFVGSCDPNAEQFVASLKSVHPDLEDLSYENGDTEATEDSSRTKGCRATSGSARSAAPRSA